MLSLLFYEYGYQYISKHFEEVIAIYIFLGIIVSILLVFIYWKVEKIISNLKEERENYQEFNISKAIVNKDWKAADNAIIQIKSELAILISKWGTANWIFRTIQIIILGFVGLFGSMLVYNQNILFKQQNHRLDQQTYLQEAERRSSLIFLFSNILDKIDDELKVESNKERELSNQLIGRIIALTEALKPYKYLEKDSLIFSEISPERGQLLLALVNSEISSKSLQKIIWRANLSYADLRGAQLNDIDLSSANLESANFSEASLVDADFSGANLKNAKFNDAVCRLINFQAAFLEGADLRKTNLNMADFRGVPIDGIFEGPQMDTDFTNVKVDKINWFESYSRQGVKGFSEFKMIFKLDTIKQIDKEGKPYYRIVNTSKYYEEKR